MDPILGALKGIDSTQVARAVVVLAVCLGFTKAIVHLADGMLARGRVVDPSLHTMLRTALRWTLYFITAVATAGVLGIPVTSFLALFSVAGLAVSLAIQGLLTNLAGGVIILASKPFTLGDYIESNGIAGTVKDIGFLHTQLISPDGKLIFVPNDQLYSSRLINYTASGERRIDLNVNASYDNTPEQVRGAAMNAVRAIDGVLPEPEPQVLVENYGDSAIQYVVRLWVASGDYLTARYALSEELYDAFRRAGVTMTYPHVNVHVQDDARAE